MSKREQMKSTCVRGASSSTKVNCLLSAHKFKYIKEVNKLMICGKL